MEKFFEIDFALKQGRQDFNSGKSIKDGHDMFRGITEFKGLVIDGGYSLFHEITLSSVIYAV